MTPLPYTTRSRKSNDDGKFYGTVSYSGAVIGSCIEDEDVGFKNADQFDAWARSVAATHKASITPAPLHEVYREFSV